jgi:predicted esterase
MKIFIGLYLYFVLYLSNFTISQLSKFNLNLDETTVSGLSSGGFMAVQFHYSYSRHIKGASIFAAGPYFCSGGNVEIALNNCMNNPIGISVNLLKIAAETHANLGLIDRLENLKDSNVYLYSGISDSVVKQGVVKKNEEMYRDFGANVKTEYKIDSEHCYPTIKNGNSCKVASLPFINSCNFNGAYESMNFILGGGLNEEKVYKEENLFEFDQTHYETFNSGLNSVGFLYVPDECKQGRKCRLHVAFHGCLQTLDDIGKKYIELTGINDVAESNNIIVLYPQVKASILNPKGCWDWWGYTSAFVQNPIFSTKLGIQNAAVWKMVQDLVGSNQ